MWRDFGLICVTMENVNIDNSLYFKTFFFCGIIFCLALQFHLVRCNIHFACRAFYLNLISLVILISDGCMCTVWVELFL
jgi:hypothetical protein